MASIEVQVLVSIAVVSGVYAFACSWRRDRRVIQAVKRIREQHPEAWGELNWLLKGMMYPEATLNALQQKISFDDPDLRELARSVKELNRRLWIALVICVTAIAATLLGTKFFGWKW